MATRTDLYGVLLEEILIEEGFNCRYDYGDLQELADSIVENGVRNPIHCYQKKGDINRYTLIEGHRRIRAVELAISQGRLNPKEFRIPMVKAKYMSDLDRALGLVTFNSGKPLHMLEEAIPYKRAQDYGASVAEIAKKVGKSTTHITNCLSLLTSTKQTQSLIKDGTVSATLVVSLLKKKEPSDVELDLLAAQAQKRMSDATQKFYEPVENSGSVESETNDGQEAAAEAPAPKVKITAKNLAVKEKKYTKTQLLEILSENGFDNDTVYDFIRDNME